MADLKLLSDVTVIVNNVVVSIVPNTVSFTEGKGEQVVKAASSGGESVQAVVADNLEGHLSKAIFALFPTETNIALARSWKTNRGENVISFTSGDFNKTFTSATLINDYEVSMSADGQIELEFNCDPAV